MLDFAWSELAVIILVAVMVLGPKELPKAMRSFAQFMKKARKMAGEFQGHLNDMARETELTDVKTAITRVTNTNIGDEVEKFIDPSGEFKRELDDTIGQTRTAIETGVQLTPTQTASPAPAVTSSSPTPTPSPASPQVGASAA
jgi:sec-independent protein translocase protein TatB